MQTHLLSQRLVKYFIAILCLLLFVNDELSGQVVEIPDANFKAWLIANNDINTNGDEEIQLSEAESYTGLMQPASQNISSLVGIEAFTEIETINCINNKLTEIDLSNNLKLKRLSCYTNDIASIDISMLVDLEYFNAHSNQLTSVDVSKNTKLIDLYLQNNQVETLDLTNLQELNKLVIYNNNFSSIDVSVAPNIYQINISDNPISTIDVSKNLNLSTFNISNANISEIDLSMHDNLRNFNCSGNNLTYLDISKNKLITSLNCAENKLVNLNLDSLLILSNLYLGNNQFSELDLSHLPELKQLEVNNNLLTSLNIANGANTTLGVFNSQNNPDLLCINVDDEAFSLTTEWTIDESSNYNEDCSTFTTSVNNDDVHEIAFYPNPVADQLNISDIGLEIETLRVYDLMGRIQYQIDQDIEFIDFSNYTPGQYILVANFNGGQQLTKRIVKL